MVSIGSFADNMASIIFHELSETVSDPLLNAWGDSKGENGDKCAWNFGYALGRAANGALYNQKINGALYYLQQEWSNHSGSGRCSAR